MACRGYTRMLANSHHRYGLVLLRASAVLELGFSVCIGGLGCRRFRNVCREHKL